MTGARESGLPSFRSKCPARGLELAAGRRRHADAVARAHASLATAAGRAKGPAPAADHAGGMQSAVSPAERAALIARALAATAPVQALTVVPWLLVPHPAAAHEGWVVVVNVALAPSRPCCCCSARRSCPASA